MKDNRGKRGRHRGPRVNKEIRLSECRLISDDGEQFGIVSMDEAWEKAHDLGLDLVEISPTASPPVVKLIDYGKFKYMQQKKSNEAKKKQITVQLKEIQFRPNIEAHDLDIKIKRAEKFLTQGDKVKMVMQFRGREMAYREAGFEKFKGILSHVVEYGAIVEAEPKIMGNRITSILAPDKKTIQKAQDAKVAKLEDEPDS